jgi:sphingomyelin phosphodiesterase acid-like 3
MHSRPALRPARTGVALSAALLCLALHTGCADPGARLSRTGLFVSDIHFNPLYDPALADAIAQAPAAQWDAIFATSLQTTCASYSHDTNAPLLTSALAAMKQRVPDPDVIFISGDLLVHYFRQLAYDKLVSNPTQAGYVALVHRTEQYLALKLTETFPNAQILPVLGDWDTDTGTTANTATPAFLSSFASSWARAVDRRGGAPSFLSTFSSGGYYSATFPIDPNARVLGLYTQPFAQECTDGCAPDAGGIGPTELEWLTDQLGQAQERGQKVWLLGHISPGIDANTTTSKIANGATCQAAVTPFWADAYSSQLYALFSQYKGVIAFGIFAHEHFDDFRLVNDPAGELLFGVKLPPSITPLHNNPAFMTFQYDPDRGAITDTATVYLANLASSPTASAAIWEQEYGFDDTYGQTAFDSRGVAGAVAQILAQPAAQQRFTDYYPTLFPAGNVAGGLTPFARWRCALNNLTVADYTTCACAQ